MGRDATERAILVGLELKGAGARRAGSKEDLPALSIEDSLEELATLATSAGAEVVATTIQTRESAQAATLIGGGKVNEIAGMVNGLSADLVIFDRDLGPTQQRNLDKALECKVIDRTQLILDIFAARARTREGQLQVELAQLNYLLPRLAGRGTSMSRLGGGIGTRGPGETQLETDRRRISQRIRKLERDLEVVRTNRLVQRRLRQSVPLATVGVVGYTNAGKSTLFNRLTRAGVLADAKMFATLDPTVRQLTLPSNRRVLLSDTVGFISNLPTALVKAFRATLEEVREASLLLHVVDASSPLASEQIAHVARVLGEIEASSTPQVLVLNKIDLLNGQPGVATDIQPSATVAVSAQTGQGIEDLLKAVDDLLPVDRIEVASFRVPHSDGQSLHMLHEYARVLEKKHCEEYSEVVAETPESIRKRLSRYLAT